MSQNQEVRIASGDALDVREFSITESMSTLFSVTVIAVSRNPDIDFEAAIGMEASFTLRGRGLGNVPRTWRGVLSELHQVRVDEGNLATYHIRIEPKLWLASQRRNNRIFQSKTELEIARQILREWDIDADEKITSTYKTRKYRVQYGETDFGFFSRMLEEAGISFYFAERDDRTVCVLSDAPQENEERALPIAYRDAPGAADHEHITAVRVSRLVRPGKLTLRDHDYRRPSNFALGASASSSGVEERLESFHYEPGAFLFEANMGEFTPTADDRGMHRTDEVEGERLAKKRLLASRGEAATISFRTNVIDVAPGTVLRVLDHPQREISDDKKLLVVNSRIEGSHDSHPVHHCEVRNAAVAYHPPLRQGKPKTGGIESATVVGPPGEEIHTDEFGRVRVQFHWDREGNGDENSSCWIHVSQTWGGAGYGGSNLPRVGQEVIVDFLGGDPDRPVITGRVYTNLQKTPYPLPENKTRSGWKSNSSPSYGGYNEIMFEDKAGNELVHMRAQRNMTTQVNKDHLSTIGNNRSTTVSKHESKSVGGNQQCVVQGDNSSMTGADFMQSVMGMFTSLASADRVLSTNGTSSSQAQNHSISSNQGTTLTVGNSVIHIGPDSIIIQTPKLLLNPGDAAATSAALGGVPKLSS
ncbi:MAG: type VI secretion system tip protein VgrG [Polyangiaceae bacterium]|nr:type VI secretion system tip protein VgrG [Polyangiaceae bacterium]